MKLLSILLTIIFLVGCNKVIIKGEIHKSEFDYVVFEYRSKKDHAKGVEVKYKDLIFKSNSSVSAPSPLEDAGLTILNKALEKVEIK